MRWAGPAAALLLSSCVPDLTGAPCRTDDNCPTHQYCEDTSGRCQAGSPPPNRVVGLVVSTPAGIVPLGASLQATATAQLQSGGQEDVTATVVWSSTDARVAQVSNETGSAGSVLAVGTGEADVVASLGTQKGSVHLVVTDAQLVLLVVVPDRAAVAARTDVSCTAVGFFTDGTHADLSSLASWTSSQPAVVSVSGGPGSNGVLIALSGGTAHIRATYQALAGGTDVTVTTAALTGLSISPLLPTVPVGAHRDLQATGTFSDGTAQPVTGNVQWTVADPALAFFSATTPGEVEGFDDGVTVVQAQTSAFTATAPLVVSAAPLATLDLQPALPDTIGIGGGAAFSAWGTFADQDVLDLSEQSAWTSSNPDLLSVLPASGAALGLDAGVASVEAAYGAASAAVSQTVSGAPPTAILVWPPSATLMVGMPASLAAERLLADGTVEEATDEAGWTSSCPVHLQVATGTRGGSVVTRSPGTCTVSAQLSMLSGTAGVVATARSVVRLEVAPAAVSLGTGGWFALRATAILDDGSVLDVTPLAAWTSSAPGIVQVGNGPEAGHGLGVDAGVAPVMVAMGGATAVTAASITTDVPTLELWPPLLQRTVQTGAALRATAVWPAGDSLDVTAWTVFLSSDPSVATVSNADGRRGELAALAPGSAQVIAQFLGVASRTAVTVGAAAPTAVAVTGPAAIPSGQPVAFQATAHFTDGSDQDVGALASWTSSANATLRVRGVGPDRGTASGLAPGQAEARALYLGISGATPVMVGAPGPTALVVEGPTGPLPSGVRVPLVARATFPGGLQLDVTARASWFSSAPGVAAVGNGPIAGWVEARLSGTAQVTATFQDLQAVAPVAVSPASLVSLSPLPPTPTGPVGVAVPIRVEGNFSDGSQVDLTAQARWASSDPSRLVISNGAGTRGLAMALVAGSTQFSVSVARPDGSQLVASALFAGAPAVPVGVEISPAAVELSISSSPRLTLGATALFSDGTAQDVGAQVSWSSADAGVASVSATGVLTAEAVGQTQVSAVLGTVVGTAPVEVVP